MKSAIVIAAPFVLVLLLVAVLYTLQSGRFNEAGVRQADPSSENAALSSSKKLFQAREDAKAKLDVQKRFEIDRLIEESTEERQKRRLKKSVEAWLERSE